jgi:hypothetical protein
MRKNDGKAALGAWSAANPRHKSCIHGTFTGRGKPIDECLLLFASRHRDAFEHHDFDFLKEPFCLKCCHQEFSG